MQNKPEPTACGGIPKEQLLPEPKTEKDYIKIIGGTHEDSTHPEFEKRQREKAMTKLLYDVTPLDEPYTNKTLLDVGCSYGSWAGYFKALGFKVTGVDISTERLKEAKLRGYKVVKASATKLPFPDNSFDVVVCLDMLVHVLKQSDRRKVVSELMRVAKSTVILSYASDKGHFPDKPVEYCRFENLGNIMTYAANYNFNTTLKKVVGVFFTPFRLPIDLGEWCRVVFVRIDKTEEKHIFVDEAWDER